MTVAMIEISALNPLRSIKQVSAEASLVLHPAHVNNQTPAFDYSFNQLVISSF